MSGMAEALAAWNFDREQGEGEWRHCPERAKPGWLKEAQETLDFLAAAGFGPVKEAWDEGYTTGNAHNGRRDANPYRAAAVRGEG